MHVCITLSDEVASERAGDKPQGQWLVGGPNKTVVGSARCPVDDFFSPEVSFKIPKFRCFASTVYPELNAFVSI